jgi:hypothetical protein
MPNWCQNKLTIYGKKEERKQVLDAVKGKYLFRNEGVSELRDAPFLLDAIIPMPDHMRDKEDPRYSPAVLTSGDLLDKLANKDESPMPDWWHWRINNWGTKWDVSPDNVAITEKKSCTVIDFDTAWSYPVGCIFALSMKFPTVKMKIAYYEPGCIGRGSGTLLGGQVIRETGVGIDEP